MFISRNIVQNMISLSVISGVLLSLSDDRLYIVMELIEGATLADHFHSLKEKLTKFEEHRIWNIFLQVSLYRCSFKGKSINIVGCDDFIFSKALLKIIHLYWKTDSRQHR